MRGQKQNPGYQRVERRRSWRVRLPVFVIAFLGGVGVGMAMRTVESSPESTTSSHNQRLTRHVDTQRELDLALSRDPLVFFRMREADGELYYTRHGRFVLDSQGTVIAPHGAILDPDVIVPSGTKWFVVTTDGIVTVFDGTTVESTIIAQIMLARFDNPAGLESLGAGRFRETVESGPPQSVTPGESGNGAVNQGCVEVCDKEASR